MHSLRKHPSFEDEDFDPEEQRLFSCLDCGRRDFFRAGEEPPGKCTFCGGCLLPMRRLSARRRSGEAFDEDSGAEVVTRYCVFCKAKLRSQNIYPACTTRRCWKQYVVLSLLASAPLEVSKIMVREYRILSDASYLRASLVTISGRRWVVDGYFRVCLPPPGLLFDGRVTMCKKREKK